MATKLDFTKHSLEFKFDAGTSRGVLKRKNTWLVKVTDEHNGTFGLGEAGPLVDLSEESEAEVEIELLRLRKEFNAWEARSPDQVLIAASKLTSIPSVRFALETAFLDLLNGGHRIIFDTLFSRGTHAIPINGLVWMGDKSFMQQQIEEKIAAGYRCIKMKIGAIDFEQELSLLHFIRQTYSEHDLTLRVDANGAFSPTEAMEKLNALSRYQLHSIEQPIKPGHREAMHNLCETTPIPIALDEELIGIGSLSEKEKLIETIRPQYLILKPTLVGGFRASREWIDLAAQYGIGWWITSALESNIGLNAIAQFTAQFAPELPQGLGTGQLYHNNIPSPLEISKGTLQYSTANSWNYSELSDLI